jgi:pimeloyl-ACP methyl ester carboxylesterase
MALAAGKRAGIVGDGTDSFVFKQLFAHDSDEYRARIACFKDIREARIEDSGHNMHHDQPAEIARLIEEFLST